MTFLCILLLSSAVHSDPSLLSNDPNDPIAQQVAVASRQLDGILYVLGEVQDGAADVRPLPKSSRDSGMSYGQREEPPEPM